MFRHSITNEQWFTELKVLAVPYGCQEGLYKTPEQYPAMARAELRSRAIEIHGMPSTDPAILQAREEAAGRRREQELSLARARGLWAGAVFGLRAGLSATTSFRGVAGAVAMGFALGGLVLGDIGWKGWTCLGLGAGLTICCARPTVITLVFLSRLAHTAGVALIALLKGWLAARECNKFRKRRLAEEDHRARIAAFVEQHLAVLLPIYNHHKNLALATHGVAF